MALNPETEGCARGMFSEMCMRYISPSDFVPLLIKKLCAGEVERRKRGGKCVVYTRGEMPGSSRIVHNNVKWARVRKRDNV